MLEKFLQTLMDGLAVGSLYALIALGYTMVYGILKFINFAHSDVFVLGAWTSLVAAHAAGWPAGEAVPITPWLIRLAWTISALAVATLVWERLIRPALGGGFLDRLPRTQAGLPIAMVAVWGWATIGLVIAARAIRPPGAGPDVSARSLLAGGLILITAMSTCGLVGFVLERLAYKPLRSAPRLNVLITAIGVSLLLQNVGQLDWMFGTRPERMPSLLPDATLAQFGSDVAAVQLRLLDVIAGGTAVVLMILLDWLVFRTKIGRAMRAVSQSPQNAGLMGIPVDRIISFTFVLGAMLAAAAGFLYGQKYPGLGQTASATWVILGLKAFVAAVVGGIGNIRGAMLGGILIGLLEFFGVAYVSPELRDIYVFGLLILVLLVRPGGILGAATVDKV